MNNKLKTVEEVRSEFARRGISFSKWAQENGIRPPIVYDLINGRTIGNRGQAHNAAVLLGLKDGEINVRVKGAA